MQLISEVSRPSFFSEEVSKEYFNLLTGLISRSPRVFASEVGTEYLAVFASSSISLLSNQGKQYFEKHVRACLLSFKKRDMVDHHKRSVFYCLMLKTILGFIKFDELKAYRLLSTTSNDVANLDEVKDLSEAGIAPEKLARLILATRYVKLF